MTSPKLLLPVLALLSAPLLAQTNWTVSVNTSSFSPKNLTIATGDTVTWVMPAAQFHDITSGSGGIADGNFDAPIQTGPTTMLTFTFDGPYVASHPMPNGTYPYFCSVHLPGMTGTIKVVPPVAATGGFGCGVNPAGSLVLLGGAPKPGQSLQIAVDNPLATQAAGSLAFLASSVAPAVNYPCGLVLPGWGMAASGANGELLLGIAPGQLLSPIQGPQLWNGAGSPAVFNVGVPNTTSLYGLRVYFQGAIVDVAPGASVGLGLTGGLRAVIGT